MASKKPLAIYADGTIRELQAGDDLSVVALEPSRRIVTLTTAGLANNAAETGQVNTGRAGRIIRAAASRSCRLRLYSTAAARTNDAGRAFTTAIPFGTQHGIILDLLLDSVTGLIWNCAPVAPFANADSPANENLYWSAQNLSGVTGTVSVDLTVITEEN